MSGSGMLLIVDDAPSIRASLRTILSNFGFLVVGAGRGEEAIELARRVDFDAVLLEINLPGIGGVDVCRMIRSRAPRLPIIILTSQDDEEHKVLALDAGADDYVTKPFRLRELVARLNSAVRRASSVQDDNQTIKIGDVELDLERRLVRKRQKLVHLTPTEFTLVRYLMEHAGQPIAHAELLRSAWGPEHENDSTYLRTFVRQIRLKLEDDPAQPRYLITDTRFGYRFNEMADQRFKKG